MLFGLGDTRLEGLPGLAGLTVHPRPGTHVGADTHHPAHTGGGSKEPQETKHLFLPSPTNTLGSASSGARGFSPTTSSLYDAEAPELSHCYWRRGKTDSGPSPPSRPRHTHTPGLMRILRTQVCDTQKGKEEATGLKIRVLEAGKRRPEPELALLKETQTGPGQAQGAGHMPGLWGTWV